MTRKTRSMISMALLIVLAIASSQSGGAQTATAPRLISFNGHLQDAFGKPLTGIQGVTFAFYKNAEDASPLWLETQNVRAGEDGQFSVFLGATQLQGLPLDLFTSGSARWLGIQTAGQSEQPRLALASVPYALAAANVSDKEAVTSAANTTKDPVTGVIAGPGLSGGGFGGDVALQVMACTNGQVLKWTGGPNGTWNCRADDNSGGTITAVTPQTGGGLVGGGTSGAVSLGLTRGCANNEVLKWSTSAAAWQCAADINSGGTITAVLSGSGLTASGTGSSVTLTIDPSVIPALAQANHFTAPQSVVTGAGGAGLTVSELKTDGAGKTMSASLIDPGSTAAVSGINANTSGPGYGVFGRSDSPAGFGGAFQNSNSNGKSLAAFASNDTEAFTVYGKGKVGVGTGGANGFPLFGVKGKAPSQLTGTVTVSGTTVTGDLNTKFLSEVTPGDNIQIGSKTGAVTAVADDQHLTAFPLDATPAPTTATIYPSPFRVETGNNLFRMDGFGALFLASTTQHEVEPQSRVGIVGPENRPNGGSSSIAIFNTASGGGNWALRVGATGTNTPAGGFSLSSNNNYRFVIDSTGNVGIGTTAPGAKLDVQGGQINASGGLCIDGDCKTAWPALGTGSVTSVSAGTGLVASPNPITTTGTISFNESYGDGRYARLGFANTFTGSLAVNGGNFSVANPTPGSAVNMFALGANRFLHGSTAGGSLCGNTFLGNNSGNLSASANCNTGLGDSALTAITSGVGNTATGAWSLFKNTNGSQNTATGVASMYNNLSGVSNTAHGWGSMLLNTGSANTAIGSAALMGSLALDLNGTTNAGSNNTAVGAAALQANTANNNTAVGQNALNANTTGTGNTGVGKGALQANTTAGGNTAVGQAALQANTANDNTAIGQNALSANTTGTGNTAVGKGALQANTTGSNTGIGQNALAANQTGSLNTAVGTAALQSNQTGTNNTAVGFSALANQTANNGNVAAGASALQFDTTGSFNVAIGLRAGAGVLNDSTTANTTGTNNTFIGFEAGLSTSTQITNSTAIGANAKVAVSNAMVLGNGAVNVGIGNSSPVNVKLDVFTATVDIDGVRGTSTNGIGVRGISNAAAGGFAPAIFGVSANTQGVWGQSTSAEGVFGTSTNNFGISGFSTNSDGVHGRSTNGTGVHGISEAPASVSFAPAVFGNADNQVGVWGQSVNRPGVHGFSTNSDGVRGEGPGVGVRGISTATSGFAPAVFGESVNTEGVWGQSTNRPGVYGFSTNSDGVRGEGPGVGVRGISTATSDVPFAPGVFGYSASQVGVWGQSSTKAGVWAESVTGPAIYAYTTGGGLAGQFDGNVNISGTLSAGSFSANVKQFRIDHPLDPAGKYLSHASIESSEMINVYSGNVSTDTDGNGVVDLPDWFQALNTDFRYQLTVIGQFAQAIVSEEIEHNQFRIKTDKPFVKVSWQVTGVRHDAYAVTHPLEVEKDKAAADRGHYLAPEAFGQSEESGIGRLSPISKR